MFHPRPWLVVPALTAVLLLASRQVGIGSPRIHGKNTSDTGDPSEQAAIQAVKKHGGSVLQELASLPELKELDLSGSAAVSNQALLDFIKTHPNCSGNQ